MGIQERLIAQKGPATRTGPAWICGCKRSAAEAVCDGTHKSL
jgi:CDGSH-type Zn-finger protein